MGSLISPFSHINLDLVLVLQQRFLTYFFFSGIRLCVYLFYFRFHLKNNMVGILVARTGRQFQRYNNGQRVVVGCIPYRLKGGMKASSKNIEDALEVLVISAQRKGKGVLFPKGGWELDETIQSAALRETIEEAGVSGTVESELGKWCFKSKGNDAFYEGHMFPLLVKEQLDLWPEKDIRQRFWVSASQAKESCQYTWMREALDLLVTRLESTPTKVEELTY